MKTVTSLDISTCHVCEKCGGKIIEAIRAKDFHLRYINLSMCRMTVVTTTAILRSIQGSRIESLVLDNNVLTFDACEVMAEVLTANPALVSLSLKTCDIPANGCVAIARSLSHNSNLRVLHMDGNCIFDRGAQALADHLPTSSITSLSIADNHVWLAGTSAFLRAAAEYGKLVALDLSYNIVDLELLASVLKGAPLMTHIAISGCKVDERHVGGFLEEVGSMKLKMLAVEAFNYNQMPVSWPKVLDMIWMNSLHVGALANAIKMSETLSSIRLGFMELSHINMLIEMYEHGDIKRDIEIGFLDFGRTSECWVASFPDFAMRAPTGVFRWGNPSLKEGASLIGSFFRRTVYEEEGNNDELAMDGIVLSGIQLNDMEVVDVIKSLDAKTELATLDLSCNDFGDAVVEVLIPFLRKSSITALDISGTNVTEIGIEQLLKSFSGKGGKNAPAEMKFALKTKTNNQLDFHKLFTVLAAIIKSDCRLESIEIDGPVTALDLTPVFEALPKNSHLKTVKITSDPDYVKRVKERIDPGVQETYDTMVKALHTSLMVNGSKCVLGEFEFPLLTNVYRFSRNIMELWQDIEDGFDSNRG